jgi:hypothetical protein
MGSVKDQMFHEEAQWRGATKIAVDAGVLTRCPIHEDVVYDPLNGDNTPAYKLGNYRYLRVELEGLFLSRTDMTDTIDAVIKDSSMECGYGAKD